MTTTQPIDTSATEAPATSGNVVALVQQESHHAPVRQRFGQDQIDLIARTIAPGCSADELELFVRVAERTGLDPFAKQIHALKRRVKNDRDQWEDRLSIQVGIDGFRLIAERTGHYRGRLGPYWCGPDGEWGINPDGKPKPWLSVDPPAAALVGVLKAGFAEPLWAVARWASYVQTTRDGNPVKMWQTMPDGQLGKCAESLALRGAFPAELSGLYSEDEMAQAHAAPALDPAQEWEAQAIAGGWVDGQEHADHRHFTDQVVKDLPESARLQVRAWVTSHTPGYRALWTRAMAEDYRTMVSVLQDQVAEAPEPAQAGQQGQEPAPGGGGDTLAPSAAPAAPAIQPQDLGPVGEEPDPMEVLLAKIEAEVGAMHLSTVKKALRERTLSDEGDPPQLRTRLTMAMYQDQARAVDGSPVA